MKTLKLTPLALLVIALLRSDGVCQSFDSGSTGADGPLDVTAPTTLTVPPDGKFNFTTITIAQGQTLRFTRNALNTPVYLLASGDVIINHAGQINVDGGNGAPGAVGAGGPGGFDGGRPGVAGAAPGAGQGPGAGRGGDSSVGGINAPGPAAYASIGTGTSDNKGAVYGNALLMPLVGGSGGGGDASSSVGTGGGGGGGAILIASSTRIELAGSGSIFARGGSGSIGGSGGAIRLVAPTVDIRVGQLIVVSQHAGGHGRIRVDTLNLLYENPGVIAPNPAGDSLSFGSMMMVFPPIVARLDIIQAAGTTIPVGTPNPVSIVLPPNSSPNRTVTVEASNFNKLVPIKVVLTPDSGTPVEYDATIDNVAANPATAIVNVTLPINIRTTISVWRR